MTELKFSVDTKHRKQWFTGISFSHPAKMSLPLQIWLIENYTKPGEVILDPMAGSGTILVACSMGRNVIAVELEEKFVKMMRGNWSKIQERGPMMGYSMGTCQILQGDARTLEGLLADSIVTSPPYAETTAIQDFEFMAKQAEDYPLRLEEGLIKGHARGVKAETRYLDRTAEGQIDNPSNIGNLPYGQVDKVITSPPYAEAQSGGGIVVNGYQGDKHSPTDLVGKRSYTPDNQGKADGQLGNLPYGNIDKIITSPPYSDEPTISASYLKIRTETGRDTAQPSQKYAKYAAVPVDSIITSPPYAEAHDAKGLGVGDGDRADLRAYSWLKTETKGQIGNLKSDSYLSAMFQVYQQCHKVLKPQGLLILVTKNFIRNKAIVRLDEDTIKLCEQAGFKFLERHYRKLTSQSFWRVIYSQKHPEVAKLDTEDILIFQKEMKD